MQALCFYSIDAKKLKNMKMLENNLKIYKKPFHSIEKNLNFLMYFNLFTKTLYDALSLFAIILITQQFAASL